MTTNLKKLIAREGLIVIGIALIGFSLAFVSDYIVQHSKTYIEWATPAAYLYEPLSFKMFLNRALTLFDFYGFPSTFYAATHPLYRVWGFVWMEHFGEFIFLWGYPIYLFIRFIIWAIKTLRK